MPLYSTTKNNQLQPIKEQPFKLEKDIQKIFEENLEQVMNLKMVKSEFSIKNKRIDTLAFDPETKAFIIIEYKRQKNKSVVDQGFTYLSLMLENKADFIVEYNECTMGNLKRKSVDWSQTRVVFVSTGFTENQKTASNFKDLAIELWEIRRYEQGILLINPVKKDGAAESIKPITEKNQKLKAVNKEIKVYSEEDHLKGKSDEVQELYEVFKEGILGLDEGVEIKANKLYLAFKKRSNIVDVVIQKRQLKLFINLSKGELEDPKELTMDVSNKGKWGNGDYALIVKNTGDLEYILSLVKQAI